MTETQAATYIAVDLSGKATSRRAHLFQDCSTLRSEEGKVKSVGTGEMALLGLRICSVCEKRKSGGPAIDVLEGFFGEDWPFSNDHDAPEVQGDPRETAWRLFEYLRDHDGYIAFRKPKGDAGAN